MMNSLSKRRPIVRERGSAYLVSLLILVIMTLLGLSLALITNTESQIGFNERVLERTFYTGDSGIGVGAARVLVASDYLYDPNDDDNNSYILNEAPGALATPLTRSRVSVGPLMPLQLAPCNLCEINNAGAYRDVSYQRTNIALPSTGERQNLADTVTQRRVAATIDIQPWKVPASSLFPLDRLDRATLAEKLAL